MHFFIDQSNLSTQTQANSYGPDSINPGTKYNLTSRFDLIAPTKAFACQDGLLIVQQSKSNVSLVNVIIKPTRAIFSSRFKVAYYIYRGIQKNSLLSGTSITPKNDLTNNELVKRIYKADSSKTNYDQAILAFDNNTLDDTKSVEALFYNKGTLHPHSIIEGEWFGNFATGSVGFEVILEPDKINVNLGFVRNSTTIVDISGTTDTEYVAIQKEQILGLLDPCAFFGLHFDSGVSTSSYAGSSKNTILNKSQTLYENVISKFYTKNSVYLDIRSEKSYSYNFYNNYRDTNGNEIQIGTNEANLTSQKYQSSNSWPILIISGSQNNNSAQNNIYAKLRIDDNDKPMLFNLAIGKPNPAFINIKGTVNTWSNAFNYAVPNTGSGTTKLNIAYYIKAFYYRRQSATKVGSRVPKSLKYYQSGFCSIDLPGLGDTSISLKKVENPNPMLIDEPLQNATGTGGFTYAANSKAIWDENNILFYSYAATRPFISSEKKFFDTLTKKITCISTTSDDIKANLDILCRLHQKLLPNGQFQDINILGVNKYHNIVTGDKDNALFLGLTLTELSAIKSVSGLNNNIKRNIYLQRTSVSALRHRGANTENRFYEYQVMVQGINSAGNAAVVQPVIITNPGVTATPILVYSRDNMFFSSIAFGVNETPSDGINRVEYQINPNGTLKINDNIDLCLIAGDQPIFYVYNNTLITQFDAALSNKMDKGRILRTSDKLTIPPPNYTATINYSNYGVNARQSYKNKAGTILTVGSYAGDDNYQITYNSLHKTQVLVHFDKNILLPGGGRAALVITYNGQNIHFVYSGTMRRYAQPDIAGRLIGALIEVQTDIGSMGFSFIDGTCFPSQTHNNGTAVDTQYKTDLTLEQRIINALHHFGFNYILKGTAERFRPLTIALPHENHDTHLHSGILGRN